jgi:hypothetical protein
MSVVQQYTLFFHLYTPHFRILPKQVLRGIFQGVHYQYNFFVIQGSRHQEAQARNRAYPGETKMHSFFVVLFYNYRSRI